MDIPSYKWDSRTMKTNVHLIVWGNGAVRQVDIPDEELAVLNTPGEALEKIFYYGQNDFQPQNLPSVSTGDVAEWDGKLFKCLPVGWKEISREEFDVYRKG
jgi:hypothetical protein